MNLPPDFVAAHMMDLVARMQQPSPLHFAARTILQTIEFGRAGYPVPRATSPGLDDAKCRASFAKARR